MRAKSQSKRSTVKNGKPQVFKRAPGTINTYLTYLSHVFTVVRKEWCWIIPSPSDDVSKLRNKGMVRYLSRRERPRLLEQTSADPILHAFVVVALSTAARAGELLRLRWRDIDLDEDRREAFEGSELQSCSTENTRAAQQSVECPQMAACRLNLLSIPCRRRLIAWVKGLAVWLLMRRARSSWQAHARAERIAACLRRSRWFRDYQPK